MAGGCIGGAPHKTIPLDTNCVAPFHKDSGLGHVTGCGQQTLGNVTQTRLFEGLHIQIVLLENPVLEPDIIV